MQEQTIPKWFIPSFWGDIKVEATSETECNVITSELTSKERKALKKLESHARKKGWIDKDTVLGTSAANTIRAPIKKVSTQLAKLMKPGRTVISAVRFHDGTMEEIRSNASIEAPTEVKPGGDKSKRPEVATSVAAPVRGCPPPDFDKAEIKAQAVLRAFLTPDQIADFDRHQRFISVGQTTGNRYMVTSRYAKDELATYTRSLYDLDRQVPVCTHDWEVPPAEEMLALHVLLQLPGWELYLNENEENMATVLAAHMGDGPTLKISPGVYRLLADGRRREIQ